ncbi:hypothetical protein BU25DRAFT_450715 [Macroventuria anomochaeta]|uniref:Uncharacterized protein n=1 Tax=Macroventuria anomochaeta TaxID=301207 RepID=A0ACB6RT70_9PLEO|nr:uncharacterized protein BU25DRAFT_450715 [Macroventuria anomochaeta]KAF2624329.1 hypothetical protein BU25DRAFT_450715 [Macroventuria anomochaeta]
MSRLLIWTWLQRLGRCSRCGVEEESRITGTSSVQARPTTLGALRTSNCSVQIVPRAKEVASWKDEEGEDLDHVVEHVRFDDLDLNGYSGCVERFRWHRNLGARSLVLMTPNKQGFAISDLLMRTLRAVCGVLFSSPSLRADDRRQDARTHKRTSKTLELALLPLAAHCTCSSFRSRPLSHDFSSANLSVNEEYLSRTRRAELSIIKQLLKTRPGLDVQARQRDNQIATLRTGSPDKGSKRSGCEDRAVKREMVVAKKALKAAEARAERMCGHYNC